MSAHVLLNLLKELGKSEKNDRFWRCRLKKRFMDDRRDNRVHTGKFE